MSGLSGETPFYLPSELLPARDELLPECADLSGDTLVERGPTSEIELLPGPVRRRRWQAAARNPLFLNDIEEVEADFAFAFGIGMLSSFTVDGWLDMALSMATYAASRRTKVGDRVADVAYKRRRRLMNLAEAPGRIVRNYDFPRP